MRQRVEDIEYTRILKQRYKHERLSFLIDYNNRQLSSLLENADILWHLTGINKHHADPASEEHFGISVALAMSYGVVPVVFHGGAMEEIVESGKNGFICETEDCIVHKSAFLIENNPKMRQIQNEARKKSSTFSEEQFVRAAKQLIQRGFLAKPFRFFVNKTFDIVLRREFKLPLRSKNQILLIEARVHYALEYVLKNALYHLGPQWGVTIVHSRVNMNFVQHLKKSMENLNLICLPYVRISISFLNQLLTSKSFWELFKDFDHVLIIQTDGLLLHGRIDSFLGYDFIGAPWHRKNERWEKLIETIPEGVGNGGMSLRSPKALLNVLQQYNASGQEDLFYVIKMVGDRRFRIPERQVAYAFSREVPCDDLEDVGPPLMVHAIWYYLQGKQLYSILEQSICGLEHFNDHQRLTGTSDGI